MSDESIWKKEVSFSRKPDAEQEEEKAGETTGQEPAASSEPDADAKETLWKREVSFESTPTEEPPAPEQGAKEGLWKREVNVEPAAEPDVETDETETEPLWKREVNVEAAAETPVPESNETQSEPLWTREISLTPEALAQPEPAVAHEPAPEAEPVFEAEPEVAEAEGWHAEPELPPAPDPVVVHPPVPAAELPGPPPEEPKVPFWKKDISLGGKKGEKVPEAEKVLASAPEVPKVPFWKKDLSLGGKKREQVVATEDVASLEPKTPFWKKDVSFGGKKRDKAPKTEAPAPVATTADAATVDAPAAKVPFWKKDLSFGGKKGGQAPKAEREPKAPKAPKASKAPRAPKVRRPRLNLELGSKSGKNFVGLKIGASQLAAAKVTNNGTAELQQVARGPLEAGIVVGGELRDPDALSEALKHFFAAHGLPKRGVRLGIANNRIGVRTFDITGVEDPKQLANAVRFRAQESLPIPIEDAVLDYQVLSEGVTEEGESTRRILLVVAYRELIDRYVDACKKAGITLTGIDLEAFALLRALHAPQDGVEGDPTAALVAVAIGHDRATFAVSDGRVCEFTRVLDWGGSALNVAIARVLDAAPSEVEGWKRALALTDEMVPDGLTSDQAQRAREAMRRAIQAFARELVSSLQYYQNQPGSLGIGEIVLTGGTAHLPGLAGELERMIGVRVRVGDPLARMKISKRVGEPEQVGSLAVAIGLGIED
jgi:type IV pilus assembly protein PilM